MQKVSLFELNEINRIKDISALLMKTFHLSELRVECFYLTQKFLDRNAVEGFEPLISVRHSSEDNLYKVTSDALLETKDWFEFTPSVIEFDCDEKIAFGAIMVYMNAIHATDEELRVGLKEMVRQLCRNEKKYHPQHLPMKL